MEKVAKIIGNTELISKNQTKTGVSVTAPLGGYIKNCLVKEGDYVSVGQPLVSITQNRRLFLRADVSEKYYGYLHSIQSANFKTHTIIRYMSWVS